MFDLQAVLVVDHNGERKLAKVLVPSMPRAVRAEPNSVTAASFESSTNSTLGPAFCWSWRFETKLVLELW